MKDLATAYMARRYSKGGAAKMCAHGGPIKCAEGCYAKGGESNPKLEESHKMAEGGEVSDEDDSFWEESHPGSVDEPFLDDDMEAPSEGSNEKSNASVDEEELKSKKYSYAKGGMVSGPSRLLSRILGKIADKHMGR